MITFSLLHASWCRPKEAAAAMRMTLERTDNPSAVEYIMCADESDESRFDLIRNTSSISGFGMPVFVEHPGSGSAPAWDFAAKFCTGQILIQMQDDLKLPPHWDTSLLEALMAVEEHEQVPQKTPLVITVRDGYRRDNLLCTAICNRARYKQVGEFLHAGYRSVFSDDDFSIRAYADEADAKCQIIRTDLVFRHENPYHTGAPHDDTLRRENSPEAYALGGRLFMERNAALVARGFKTW